MRHERIYLGPPVSKRDAGIFQPNVERSRSACYKFCEVMFFFLARSVLQSSTGSIVQNHLVKSSSSNSNKFQGTCVWEKVVKAMF